MSLTIRKLHSQWKSIYSDFSDLSKKLSKEHRSSKVDQLLDAEAVRRGTSYPIHWLNLILTPLAAEIGAVIGAEAFSVGSPSGISSRVTVSWYKNKFDENGESTEKPILTAAILPENLSPTTTSEGDEELDVLHVVDFTDFSNDYPPGTVGFYNGLNFKSIPLPNNGSAKDIAEILEKTYKAAMDDTAPSPVTE